MGKANHQSINKELEHIFLEMSEIYQMLGPEHRFRVIAYQKASRAVGGIDKDLSSLSEKELVKLHGIGKSIALKIIEYCKTGKIARYEELRKSVPYDLISLIDIQGFGPESLKKIHKELGINSREQLISALNSGKVSALKGFGKKKIENMLKGLDMAHLVEKRMPLWDALEIGETMINFLKKIKGVKNAEIAGSLRRRRVDIGDIDILVAADKMNRKKIVEAFISNPEVYSILAKGETKASIIVKEKHRQVDMRIIAPDEWGAALQYFTGSKDHNVHLREIAKNKGFKVSEYGVFNLKTGKKIAGPNEEEVYNVLGFQWIPPELREDKGELELAAKKKIPRLVTLNDINGDMHMHSDWTDGVQSIEEIAENISKNYPYEYVVLTDHSKSVRVAGGMDEDEFRQQIKAIKEVNKKIGKDLIKYGAEVDILQDGELDLAEDLLSELDWVVASIHSAFSMDNTNRLIAACENPYVSVIGHPTGRILGMREAYKVDMDKVIKSAANTGTAMEINAQPHRMDLDDIYIKKAMVQGVKFVISTDSHRPTDFRYMNLGVFLARRAGCTKEHILNTHSWSKVKTIFNQKKEGVMISG